VRQTHNQPRSDEQPTQRPYQKTKHWEKCIQCTCRKKKVLSFTKQTNSKLAALWDRCAPGAQSTWIDRTKQVSSEITTVTSDKSNTAHIKLYHNARRLALFAALRFAYLPVVGVGSVLIGWGNGSGKPPLNNIGLNSVGTL